MSLGENFYATAKHVGDAVSIGTLIGSFVQLLPHAAAALTVIWMAIRIYLGLLEAQERRLRIRQLREGKYADQ